ncbi:MAG TPA: PucR family transcriptional regulator ligand-binding domain-containing protein [Acidimicrobiales bacterium]
MSGRIHATGPTSDPRARQEFTTRNRLTKQTEIQASGLNSSDIRLPTVAEILELPEVRRGRPTIEAGANFIDRPVRWAHVSELVHIGHLLQGGELILSTAVAFPHDDKELINYISDLAAAHAAGLIIELGQHFNTLPEAMIRSAEVHGLPLVALHTEVPFVAITEAIHSIIVNTQIGQLQLGEAVHRAFRSLAADASTPQEIVAKVAQLAGCPAVFESSARHVVAFAGATTNGTEVLDNWEKRSGHVAWSSEETRTDGETWLTTLVSARGHKWGRLILLSRFPADNLQRTILELGATTLALHLLIERDERVLEHQTHRTLIADMIDQRYSSPEEIYNRSASLGVPTRRQVLVALIVRSEWLAELSEVGRQSRAREEETAVSRALHEISAASLVGILEPGRIGILISAPTNAQMRSLIELAAHAIHENTAKLTPLSSVVIGVGSTANTVNELRHSFGEANEAADAARSLPRNRLFVTTADIRLRGLIHLLRDDPRLQSYVERELGPLIEYDTVHRTQLVATLGAYLEARGNKSEAASLVHTTRATFYHHLSRIEEVLKVNLESPESLYSLYVALIARQSLEN